jgi:hypothetical protein
MYVTELSSCQLIFQNTLSLELKYATGLVLTEMNNTPDNSKQMALNKLTRYNSLTN